MGHNAQPKEFVFHPESPVQAICSAQEGTSQWHEAAPCTHMRFQRELGIATWLPVTPGTVEGATRAPQVGHVFRKVYFLPFTSGLLGLIFSAVEYLQNTL